MMTPAVRCDAAAGVLWAAAADPIPALARTTPAVMAAATIPRPDTCGIEFPNLTSGQSVSGTRQPLGRTGLEVRMPTIDLGPGFGPKRRKKSRVYIVSR